MLRPKIIKLNANEPVFYPLSIKVNKCGGDRNNTMTLWQNYAYLPLLET